MLLKIFLTADLHLGMKFAHLPEVQSELAEARFECLKRLVALANQRRADLLVVAGDLFDRVSTARRDVQRAAALLGDFQGTLCAVLPGNHDYLAPDDELWKRFKEASGGSVLLLEERMPYALARFGLDACLYPGPCVSKHSKSNAIGWVKGVEKDRSVSRHIGVAHGSLEGFSPDFNADYYPMKAAELREAGPQLWLLGHTHNRFPGKPGAGDRIYCAGTPEPDGFDCAHEGCAWVLTLTRTGGLEAEAVPTGEFRFLREGVAISGVADLAALEKRYSVQQAKRFILKVTLNGRLPPEAFPELERSRERLSRTVRHLQWDSLAVREEVSRETIDREYPSGSFPHHLLHALAEKGDTLALETAYELLREALR
jgi:exonuclease SbcD